ncbi:beta barrel domain-containing protein [Streptomyces sp. NBC_01485]|uniref:beta barrel domain-containing protein n=1 Tax=Streptomyces sp. NBC_01485 TaxID=2903884 RepID=UPI003FCEB9BD
MERLRRERDAHPAGPGRRGAGVLARQRLNPPRHHPTPSRERNPPHDRHWTGRRQGRRHPDPRHQQPLPGDETVTVSRIGSKYLYVTRPGGSELRDRFHRESGVEDSQHGTPQRLYTPAQYDESKQHASLLERLREAGIEFRHGVSRSLTTDQLRALLAIMQPDA